MPLIKIDVVKGRSDEEIKLLLDTAHEAVVGAFGVPVTDRYQVLTQHAENEIVIMDTGLGIKRSRQFVLFTIESMPRNAEKKQRLYQLLTEKLQQRLQIKPEDVMVSIVCNEGCDWSFGLGEAQFITGKL